MEKFSTDQIVLVGELIGQMVLYTSQKYSNTSFQEVQTVISSGLRAPSAHRYIRNDGHTAVFVLR
jgi:hypothetical protein